MIIAFSGYARSGKDTAAEALEECGWKRIAFATKLKTFTYEQNPIIGIKRVHMFRHVPVHLQDVIDEWGVEGCKNSPYYDEIRRLWQRTGTEAGRRVLGNDVWVNAALDGLSPNSDYVISDCRFPNEASAVRRSGGLVIRITRDGVGPANSHPSETSLDGFNFNHYITNNSPSADEFKSVVRDLISNLGAYYAF